jgi:hypothetical protein
MLSCTNAATYVQTCPQLCVSLCSLSSKLPSRNYLLTTEDLTVHVHAWFPKEPEHKQAPSQHTLFDLAMSDASLFQAIMCSSSLCLDMAYGRPESSHSIIHRMEAIHLINARLKANSRISDATIGAVAFLAIIEVCPSLMYTSYRLYNINSTSSYLETTKLQMSTKLGCSKWSSLEEA